MKASAERASAGNTSESRMRCADVEVNDPTEPPPDGKGVALAASASGRVLALQALLDDKMSTEYEQAELLELPLQAELMMRLCSIFHFSNDGAAPHIQEEECALLKCIVVRFGCCQLGASEIYELLVAFANLWPELRGEIVEAAQQFWQCSTLGRPPETDQLGPLAASWAEAGASNLQVKGKSKKHRNRK